MVEQQRINLLERQVLDLKEILVSENTMNKENEFSSFNQNDMKPRLFSIKDTISSQEEHIRSNRPFKVTIADQKPPSKK